MGDAENRLAEGGGRADQQHAQEERLRQQEEMKHSILSQILNQGARARCKYAYLMIMLCTYPTHPFIPTPFSKYIENQST